MAARQQQHVICRLAANAGAREMQKSPACLTTYYVALSNVGQTAGRGWEFGERECGPRDGPSSTGKVSLAVASCTLLCGFPPSRSLCEQQTHSSYIHAGPCWDPVVCPGNVVCRAGCLRLRLCLSLCAVAARVLAAAEQPDVVVTRRLSQSRDFFGPVKSSSAVDFRYGSETEKKKVSIRRIAPKCHGGHLSVM
jgi:hypothetical protein